MSYLISPSHYYIHVPHLHEEQPLFTAAESDEMKGKDQAGNTAQPKGALGNCVCILGEVFDNKRHCSL